jgi:hypothetical protein
MHLRLMRPAVEDADSEVTINLSRRGRKAFANGFLRYCMG